MTNKRIIPCLDVKDGRVVKGVQFVQLKDAGDPVELARFYDEQGADELVFLDISASTEGRKTMVDVVKEVAAQLTIPFIVGGGIHSIDDMERILQAGANKVSIGSAAVKNPDIIREGAKAFGSEKIVVAVDAKFDKEIGTWCVYIKGGKEKTDWNVIDWVKEVEKLGAGEILLTSMDRDGAKNGYDLPLTKAVSEAVSIPVIASGGAGSLEHFLEAFVEGKADGALAASVFHYKETSVKEVKAYLKNKGVNVK